MQRLLIGNFDFEHRLGRHASGQMTAAVETINRELAAVLVAVADEDDLVFTPTSIDEAFFDQLADNALPRVKPVCSLDEIDAPVEVTPWGWTETLRDLSESRNWRCPAPPHKLIRTVNSRQFSFGLEQEWGCGLPHQRTVDSFDSFTQAVTQIASYHQRWVVKAQFGMSARERVLGEGADASEQIVNWVRKRLATDGVVFLEPWVERIEEAGLQFTIPHSGPPLFEGAVPMQTDTTGVYRGSRISLDVDAELRWAPAIETGMRVARELKQRGYFGPLGIDAVRYRDHNDRVRIRSIQDINARHTMGRLALGFRRILAPGEHADWIHARWPTHNNNAPALWMQDLEKRLPEKVRVVHTSPYTVGGQPVGHGTFVLIAPTKEDLDKAKEKIDRR